MQLDFEFQLPILDENKTRKAVEEAMQKYRICKYLTADEREASTTASYSERFHGPTNTTSDQTADIAVHNVTQQQAMKDYCERVERAVGRLDKRGRILMTERYMREENVKDIDVYMEHLHISSVTYSRLKWRTFYKIALILKIEVIKEKE